MSVLFDAGALIALERGGRFIVSVIRNEQRFGRRIVTHGGVLAQVWRGGARQARLARTIRGFDVIGIGTELGKRAGELLARSGTRDVVDAALVALAREGDEIFTSDPHDLMRLAEAASIDVDLVRV